jgi:hypothetical protein
MDSFDVAPYVAFAASRPDIPLAAAAAYLALLVLGPRAMAQRPALTLRVPLFAWNAALYLYYAAGALFMLRHAAGVLAAQGLGATLCGARVYATGVPALWLTLFTFSKLPELVGTVFLVLRKDPLGFLHCYYHASVMLYCWFAFALRSRLGYWFTLMSYVVHAVVYLNIVLTSLGFAPPWGSAVRLLQIAQMVAGCALCAYSAAVGCEARGSLAAAVLLYASYLVLFCSSLWRAPARRPPASRVKGGKAA